MTDRELLAIAVLKGDEQAAMALADLVAEECRGLKSLPPVQRLDVDSSRCRVVVLVDGLVNEDETAAIRTAVQDWLAGTGPLVLGRGVRDIRVYELPKERVGEVLSEDARTALWNNMVGPGYLFRDARLVSQSIERQILGDSVPPEDNTD